MTAIRSFVQKDFEELQNQMTRTLARAQVHEVINAVEAQTLLRFVTELYVIRDFYVKEHLCRHD